MKDEIRLIARFTLEQGSEERFAATARRCAESTLANEPGALSYRYYLDSRVCHVLERYADSSAVLAHFAGEVGTKLIPRLLESAKLDGLDLYGNPSTELLAALEGKPVRVFTFLGGHTR